MHGRADRLTLDRGGPVQQHTIGSPGHVPRADLDGGPVRAELLELRTQKVNQREIPERQGRGMVETQPMKVKV